MSEENKVVKKFDWKSFVVKSWNQGLKSALDEVVASTENKFDNAGVTLVDNLVNYMIPLLPDGKKKD